MSIPKDITAANVASFIDSYDNFIFDCDGVLWRTTDLVPGANKTLDFLKEKVKYVF
jgi:ribonucleotide monophosphatase NagD (HAD superfamily)